MGTGSKSFVLILVALFLASLVILPIVNSQSQFPADIHITANGSVTGTDNIERDGNTYTFTDTVRGSIVVETSNIVIDGANQLLQGPSTLQNIGIALYYQDNITMRNVNVQEFSNGIWLLGSSNDLINNNTCSVSINNNSNNDTVSENYLEYQQLFGVGLQSECSNNVIQNNLIINDPDGIDISDCQNNTVIKNTIANCSNYGVFIEGLDNTFTENNFVSNKVQVGGGVGTGPNNWNRNYWSDYNGSGPYKLEYGVSETGQPVIDYDYQPLLTQVLGAFPTQNPASSSIPTPTPTVPEFPVLTIPMILIIIAVSGLLVHFKKQKLKITLNFGLTC